MSETDPFSGGVQAPEGDPFADQPGEAGFTQEGDDPFADEGPAPGAPVVNAEGEVIEGGEATQVAASADPAAVVEEEEALRAWAKGLSYAELEDALGGINLTEDQRKFAQADMDQRNAGRPTAQAESTSSEEPGAEAGSEVEVGPTGQTSEESTAPTSGEADPTQAAPAASPSPEAGPEKDQQQAPSPVATAASAPATTQSSPSPASATNGRQPSPDGQPSEAEAVERENEVADDGKIVRRSYKLLTPEGNGKWREVTWYEDADGKMVEKGAEGARKQNSCVVRGQPEALRIGWRAMGQPQDGCKLVAVSASNLKVKTVGPEVKPEPRVKLAIR